MSPLSKPISLDILLAGTLLWKGVVTDYGSRDLQFMPYNCREAIEETRWTKGDLKEEWVKMCIWMILSFLVWKMEITRAG